MKKLLIRADDLGYCEAVNYGINRAVRDGVVRCVGVMTNMEWAEHGVRLLDGTDVIFTVHTNICQGRPLTDPALVPSLVDENGNFKDKSLYRQAAEDFVVLEEAILEVEAQYQRLVRLTGRKPYMVEIHAVPSANFFRAVAIVAQKHGVASLGFDSKGRMKLGKLAFRHSMDSDRPDYVPFESMKKAMEQELAQDEAVLMVLHPGYVDDYVLNTSYITVQRAREVAFATDPRVSVWCAAHDVQLITYADL
ncbi:MAG: ChbG/HpnK family deacetylase [Oscillospiraceae bacterium]|nr:ChbG/HpnK family deacetylase [Oscillospiraceae bacterium]